MRRIDHADVGAVGLGLQQALARARHPHRVAERREDHPGLLGDGDAIVDAAHRQHADRAAGAVHQLDLLRQHALDAVAEDRMGVAAADFHDLQRPIVGNGERGGQALDLLQRGTRPWRGRGIRRHISCRRLPWSSPSRGRRRAACARDPTGCDRRRRGIPGCGGSRSSGPRGNGRRRRSCCILPPSPPARPIVARPISFALAKAAMRLAELPLVEMPIRPSPARACAITWRTKTCSKPTSLPTAEIIAMSATRLIAASAGRPAVIGWTNSTATCDGVAARTAIAHREQAAATAVDVGERLGRRDQDRRLGRQRSARWCRASRAPSRRSNGAAPRRALRAPALRRGGTDRAP